MEVVSTWYGGFHCVEALLDVMVGLPVDGIELQEATTGSTTQERANDLQAVGRTITSKLRVVLGGLQLQLRGLIRDFACESGADLIKPPEPLKRFLGASSQTLRVSSSLIIIKFNIVCQKQS